MSLIFEHGGPFSQGACPYQHRPISEEETTNRILLDVEIDGQETQAVVDTGGVWLVCDPEIAAVLGLDPQDGADCPRLWIRGESFRGTLHRLPLTLLATEGHSLRLEGTAFVPEPESHQRWRWPSFLGFHGCLERIHFAVDTSTRTFYFGPSTQVH
jgi:hypothetical protein